MARPREFDAQQVLRDAMLAFWHHGYEATSISDLVDGTKLARGSLYGAFGDKHQLFLAALKKYGEETLADMRHSLSRPGPARQVLEQYLAEVHARCCGHEGLRGCLLTKAVMELAPENDDVAQWARDAVGHKIDVLAQLIARGQTEGDIKKTLDAAAAARTIMTTLAGLRLMGAMSPSSEEVAQVIAMIQTLLD